MQTKYAAGQRVRDREDGSTGRVYRVLTGAAVDYATPLYEIIWDHAPGEPALGSRVYADELEAIECQWFALCDHEATTTRPHPLLGPVPICARCDARVDKL